MVEMARVATVVEATSQPMARRDPLRAHMDLIYREVRTELWAGSVHEPLSTDMVHAQAPLGHPRAGMRIC